MTALVEVDSMLSFQHHLTSALINTDVSHPLLFNLPFWSQRRDGEVHISEADFSERRLSLIDGKLSRLFKGLIDLQAYFTSCAVQHAKID